MTNAKKAEQRELALQLLADGVPITEAARRAGIADVTVRRALAELGRASTVDLKEHGFNEDEVTAGWDFVRSELALKMAARLEREVDTADLSKLRDGAVSYGILDDKLNGRGVGGGTVNVTQATQIIVKSEWPEP